MMIIVMKIDDDNYDDCDKLNDDDGGFAPPLSSPLPPSLSLSSSPHSSPPRMGMCVRKSKVREELK